MMQPPRQRMRFCASSSANCFACGGPPSTANTPAAAALSASARAATASLLEPVPLMRTNCKCRP